MASLLSRINALQWVMFEKGLGRYWQELKRLVDSAPEGGVAGVATYGAVDTTTQCNPDVAPVTQNSGAGRVAGNATPQQPDIYFGFPI